MVVQIVLLAIGFFLLVKGADYFVEGAAGIADWLGIPQLVIGLTIVAMGTSAPEAAVSIAAAWKGNAEITIGNVVGSNIFNILVILGITSCMAMVAVAHSTVRYELPYMIGVTVLVVVFGMTGNTICLWEGMILLAAFGLYLTYLFCMSKKRLSKQQAAGGSNSMCKMVIMGIAGLFLVVLGSDVTVDASVKIASFLGVSQRTIALTIVAMGTSLPELVTSVSAARKGKSDIAIGNIVGSNIFNLLVIVGVTTLITPVSFPVAFIPDTVISAAAGVLLLVCMACRKKLDWRCGIILLLGYVGYFIYIIK